jgi:hypothetical protein
VYILWVGFYPNPQILNRPEKVARDKRSSLFVTAFRDKDSKCFIKLKSGVCIIKLSKLVRLYLPISSP